MENEGLKALERIHRILKEMLRRIKKHGKRK